MKCRHCGGSRHTKDSCFKLIGYPEWWDDLQRKKATTKAPMNRAGGKALFTAIDSTGGGHTEGLEKIVMEVGEDGTKSQKKEGERKLLGEGEIAPAKGKGNGKFPYVRFYKGIQENHVTTPNPTPTPNNLNIQINSPPSPKLMTKINF